MRIRLNSTLFTPGEIASVLDRAAEIHIAKPHHLRIADSDESEEDASSEGNQFSV